MLTDEMKKTLVSRLETKEEGYRQFAYDDATGERVKAPKGNLTIGIGFNLDAGCPLDLARMIAFYFVDKCQLKLSQTISFFNDLDQVRQAILVDMAFNMGADDVIKFKNTLADLATRNYKEAANNMRDSRWYKQVPNRVEPLARAMERGEFDD